MRDKDRKSGVREISQSVPMDDIPLLPGGITDPDSLTVLCRDTRSKSPVTVQEWVAALVSDNEVAEDRLEEDREDDVKEEIIEENDNLTLGAEAGGFADCPVQCSVSVLKSKGRLGQIKHTDTLSSIASEESQASNASVDSVLQSRAADPEAVLQNLGFAGTEALAKIPVRFLQQPSKAKGMSVDLFKKQQDELVGRFESGFFGYRGLQGSLHRRPSQLVEKILKALQEKELNRKGSAMSWSSQIHNGASSIPTRFKKMDPERPTFDTLVTQVTKKTGKDKLKAKSFKSLARSVLSPENRVWRQEQIEKNKRKAAQLLILGGKSFLVDDEGNEEEVTKNESEHGSLSPIQRQLTKQDSLLSLISNNSFDSDWSDEENVELERKFGGMSCRSEKSDREDLMKRSQRRSRSRKSGSATPPSFDNAKLVYSRESSTVIPEVTPTTVADSSFIEQCAVEEVCHEKLLG